MLAGGGVGTPGRLQCLVFVVYWAVSFAAEEVVLEGMFISDMRAEPRFELCKLVGSEGRGAK